MTYAIRVRWCSDVVIEKVQSARDDCCVVPSHHKDLTVTSDDACPVIPISKNVHRPGKATRFRACLHDWRLNG